MKKSKAPIKETSRASLLDLVCEQLKYWGRPMASGELAEELIKTGAWAPNGKTPERTLYSCLHLEMKRLGDKSRFKRVGTKFDLK